MSTPNRKRQRKRHAKQKVAAHSSNTSQAQAIGTALDANFNKLFGGPRERIEHDLNLEHVTLENYRSAEKFIHACEKVGAWRLDQGELSGDSGHHLTFLAREIAHGIRVLIEHGDLMVARQLPLIVETFQTAMQMYGSKVTGRVTKRLPIDQLLQKHKAHDLLAMLTALYPAWDKIHQIQDRRAIEQMSEVKLRELLLSQECWVHERDGKRTENWRKHRLTATIENILAMREGENANINLFVEHLMRGQLWGGPGATFAKCDWWGKKDLPARGDVRAWMKIVIPFLRRVTQDDAMKLGVFSHLIAARKAVYIGDKDTEIRLADDKTDYIWNQVRARIAQAWKTMASRAGKRNSKKLA